MVLLRTALLAALLLTALAPVGGYERSRRAGRRRGSNSPSDRAPPPGAGQGRVPESTPELDPELDPDLDPELDPELAQLLGAAPFPSATNSSALSRSPRVKRTLVIPNGLTVGVIPRFDYTVFTDPNGEPGAGEVRDPTEGLSSAELRLVKHIQEVSGELSFHAY
ncbi:hypothetical protein FJT64_027777 [Amphibalanus amphitrite]|uniref:Uncharacterized protein n=1 Tax=Amphibalanus amphitrite TaxID=1232801 RepID=A0A6A4WC27_AMPAM|nr:hypothetical protein FJT64_027777 [Amphibalanus amphitrite]